MQKSNLISQGFKDGDIITIYEDKENKEKYKKVVIFKDFIYMPSDSLYIKAYAEYNIDDCLVETKKVEINVEIRKYRFATEEEIQQLFNALRTEGKYWDINTKKIKNLSKVCRLNKKKIEEAAYDFEDGELIEDKLKRAFFKCGVKWLKENLWHDASEEPKQSKDNIFIECLTLSENGDVDIKIYNTICHLWLNKTNNEPFIGEVTHWLYIDDLIGEEKVKK